MQSPQRQRARSAASSAGPRSAIFPQIFPQIFPRNVADLFLIFSNIFARFSKHFHNCRNSRNPTNKVRCVGLIEHCWQPHGESPGFVQIATDTEPQLAGWLRAGDLILHWHGWRFVPLSTNSWFAGAWTVASQRATVVAHDAPPLSESAQALMEQLRQIRPVQREADARREASGYAQLGYSYLSLQLSWPRASDKALCPAAVHVTLGYLPRMDARDLQRLQHMLCECLAAWLSLDAQERPYDQRVLYSRAWRVRPQHFSRDSEGCWEAARLAALPRRGFAKLLHEGRIEDAFISDDSDFDDRATALHARDNERWLDAMQRAQSLPVANDGTWAVAHRPVFAGNGDLAGWVLDGERSAELCDLLYYLCDMAKFFKPAQVQYKNKAGATKLKPPSVSGPWSWHVSPTSSWIRRAEPPCPMPSRPCPEHVLDTPVLHADAPGPMSARPPPEHVVGAAVLHADALGPMFSLDTLVLHAAAAPARRLPTLVPSPPALLPRADAKLTQDSGWVWL